MAANDYRAYLRNHIDMEEAPARAPQTGSTHRALIFGTLTVMGLLQVASSVAILLHLTGYLREVDLASAQQSPNEEMHSETLIADPRDPRILKEKKERCRQKKDTRMPSAHLPIKASTSFSISMQDRNGLTMIHWDVDQGSLKKIAYQDGRILVNESGYYYVYAHTCFRYAEEHDSYKEDVSNLQLFQYIYHESHTQSVIKPVILTKSGGTLQWNIPNIEYNMYCVEQGRGVHLKKGDGIFVNVSNAWLLDPAAEGTYFGTFKISD